MSNNLNQGASIEAERADFEEWSELTDHQKRGAQHEVVGWYYFDEVTNDRWEAWQASAARRTPAPAGAGELPQDPFASVQKFGMAKLEIGRPSHYTGEFIRLSDARAAIAADRAQLARQGNGEPVAIVVNKGGQLWIDFLDGTLKVGDQLYLAAPASAQPADISDALDRAMARIEAHNPQYTEEWLKSVVEIGAQPDRGAAQGDGTVPMCETCDDPAMPLGGGQYGPCAACLGFADDAAPHSQPVRGVPDGMGGAA